jgi:serine protease Do
MDLAALAERLRRVTVEVSHGDDGAGAGVIWAPGWVVTNAHVARRPRVVVRLADGRGAEGLVVAWAGDADLAAVRTTDVGAPALFAAEPAMPRVGSLVVAVGHPFGVRGALTAGIVHAVAPMRPGGRPWIQADLRLAPGNSGGPLADAEGRLLGLNAMVAGSLALAIPVGEVRRFLRSAGVPGS